MQFLLLLVSFIIHNSLRDTRVISIASELKNHTETKFEKGTGPPVYEDEVDMEYIAELFRKKDLLTVLQNGDVSVILRAKYAEDYLEETRSMAPNITKGGLCKDW